MSRGFYPAGHRGRISPRCSHHTSRPLSAPNNPTLTNAPDSAAKPDATLSHNPAGDDRLSTLPGPDLSAEPVPPAVGRYTVVAEIARGGMGVVYRATDPGLNREVAVKLIRTSFRTSAAAVRRFNDEAIITGHGRVLVAMERLAPWIMRAVGKRMAARGGGYRSEPV